MKFNKLVPELSVSDLLASLEFYKKIGFKVEYERKEGGFAFLSFEGSQIMLHEKNEWVSGKLEKPFGRGVNFQIEVKDVAKIYQIVKKNKLSIFLDLKESEYNVNGESVSCKEFIISDPDGYLLRFSEVV